MRDSNPLRPAELTQGKRVEKAEFINALEAAKRALGAIPGKEATNRSLAAELRMAPSRLGSFLDSGFAIKLDEKDSAGRKQKLVSGFTASLYRTAKWLVQNGHLVSEKWARASDREQCVRSLVRSYWDPEKAAVFGTSAVQNAIRHGYASEDLAVDHRARVRVTATVLNWGPFAHVGQDGKAAGFLREYGDKLLRGIDPLECETDFPIEDELSAALANLPKSRKDEWVATIGLYDDLYRRFKGLEFVTFPLRVPLVGLIVSRDEVGHTLNFSEVFGRKGGLRRFAIDHEVGHLFLGSILGGDEISVIDSKKRHEEIAVLLQEAADADGSVAFLADAVLSAELYAALQKLKGVHVQPLGQGDDRRHELAYRIGFVLRAEDQELVELLEASQKELFRTSWMVKGLFESLVDGAKAWSAKHKLDSLGWEEPIFVLDDGDIAELMPNAERAQRLVAELRQFLKPFSPKLFDTGEPR